MLVFAESALQIKVKRESKEGSEKRIWFEILKIRYSSTARFKLIACFAFR